MKTKRELLLLICENPGYVPADSSSEMMNLASLYEKGWIRQQRSDGGFEATSKALGLYPDFTGDLADPAVSSSTTPTKEAVGEAMSAHVERMRARIQVAHARGPTDGELLLLELLEDAMAAIDDISTQVDALVSQLDAFEAAVTQAFADLQAKIANLGLDPATVSHIESAISGAQASITSAQSAAVAADPGPPPAPPAPPAIG